MMKRWDFFSKPSDVISRSGMAALGLLLLTVIALTIYELWDIAIKRWLG